MPRASQENKILEAALQCFAELGYEGTRIRQIAERAGVAESALYRHYPSKEVVAHTLFQHHCQDLITKLQEVAALPLSVEDKLRGFVRSALDDYRSNPAAIAYVMLQPPNFEQSLPDNFISPLEIIATVISEGQQEGSVRSGPPHLLACAFVGCFIQIFAFAHLPFFETVKPCLILENEHLIVDMAWAAIANSG